MRVPASYFQLSFSNGWIGFIATWKGNIQLSLSLYSILDSSIFIGFIVSIDYFSIHKFLQLYKCDTKLMDLFMLVVVSFNNSVVIISKSGFWIFQIYRK